MQAWAQEGAPGDAGHCNAAGWFCMTSLGSPVPGLTIPQLACNRLAAFDQHQTDSPEACRSGSVTAARPYSSSGNEGKHLTIGHSQPNHGDLVGTSRELRTVLEHVIDDVELFAKCRHRRHAAAGQEMTHRKAKAKLATKIH